MTQSRHQRLEALFEACAALPVEQRAAWLDQHCADDPALRAELGDLLSRDQATGGASLTPFVRFPASAPLPETIGPYRVLERLGEGGFGEVYAAEQTTPVRRRVALKVLKAGMDSRAVIARFDAERQALALMDHPGIARVFDAGVTETGRPYFVMELVSGETITAFCDDHALSTRARLELMIAVCRAVEHAHQKGIIHRDLKPSNILVAMADGKPSPRVIDFGIAKATGGALGEGTLHTQQGEFLGTPEYASPEQAESVGADVDTRTDVYALGAVLYRLLTGSPVFESERLRRSGITGMARILREEEPPRPSDRVGIVRGGASGGAGEPGSSHRTSAAARELRGDLDWITLKALEKDRSRRYPSAAGLADDLLRHLRHEPVLAGSPSTTYRLRKFMRRRRGPVVGAAAVLLTLVAGLAATGWQAVRARRAEEDARRKAEAASAVNSFLTRMLGEANPELNPRGADVTVREIVDRAARELDASPPTDAEIEAGVRHALGTTYKGLALYDSAESQFRRAAELRARAVGLEGREALESRLSLAELKVRRGQYAAAESALAGLEGAVSAGADRANRIRYLRLRGDNLNNLSRNEAADSMLVAAAAAAREGAARDSMTLAGALLDLARARDRMGRFAEAESLGGVALAITRRSYQGDHYEVASSAGALANFAHHNGHLAAADSLHREQLEIVRRVLGPRHPTVAYALTNLAVVLADLGRNEEAERCHREGLEILSAAFGNDHPEVVSVMGSLATALQNRGAYDEALPLRRTVIEKTRRLRGPGHPEVASALNNLGSLYRLMHRFPEAEAVFQEAIAIFRQAFGDEHPLVAVATHNLGKTRLDHGRTTEAEATLRAALALGKRVFPADHVNLALFSLSHGRALAALRRYAEAERELLPARERISATFGPAHARTREAAGILATLYERWGRPEQAAHWRAVGAGDSLAGGSALVPRAALR